MYMQAMPLDEIAGSSQQSGTQHHHGGGAIPSSFVHSAAELQGIVREGVACTIEAMIKGTCTISFAAGCWIRIRLSVVAPGAASQR